MEIELQSFSTDAQTIRDNASNAIDKIKEKEYRQITSFIAKKNQQKETLNKAYKKKVQAIRKSTGKDKGKLIEQAKADYDLKKDKLLTKNKKEINRIKSGTKNAIGRIRNKVKSDLAKIRGG